MATLEISFSELAEVALGTNELTPTHIAVLHSVIQLLLKKLDCQDEKVTLSGYEARCFEQELKKSKIPVLPFNDEKMALFADKFKMVDELEERSKSIEEQLKRHAASIEIVKNVNTKELNWRNWDQYKTWCENLCSLCIPENEIPCQLLQNADFLRQMCRRISEPMVYRLFTLEQKVSEFSGELDKFMLRIKEHLEKIGLIEDAIKKMDLLMLEIKNQNNQFLSTMEEIQELLDCKLNKLHLPALKKYIGDRLTHIENTLRHMQERSICQQAAGIIMHGIQCASCKNSKICARVSLPPIAKLPPLKRPHKKYKKSFCGCERYEQLKIQNRTLKPTQLLGVLKTKNLPKMQGCGSSTYKEPEYIKGTEGFYYRRG